MKPMSQAEMETELGVAEKGIHPLVRQWRHAVARAAYTSGAVAVGCDSGIVRVFYLRDGAEGVEELNMTMPEVETP